MEEILAPEDLSADPPAVTPRGTWLARALRWPRHVCWRLYSLAAPPPAFQLNATELAAAKAAADDLDAQLKKTRSRLRVLKDKLKRDYGPSGEFSTMVDRCFDLKVNQYTYEVCPYKRVTQKEDGSQTTVGNFRRFEDDHRTMVFDNGEHCWNGPSRSIKVHFKCGAKEEVLSVDEPSRCEYSAVMTTPAVCSEHEAKEMEARLQAMLQELQGDL
eukprot:TRINITY_DN5717_c0_g2_i1.p1 TRINITY_DN5717_c0_g2~~TRINITY_DN5717_c0_g2_i1.p1  ORF type:complete len:243 (+),score=24.14 TRINITY_DN5717_c0_g2_i1:86-730(+)